MNSKVFLLTGARAPVALSIALELVRIGHSVILTDSTKNLISTNGKEKIPVILTSSPNDQPRRYIRELQSICQTYGVDLIIPLCEEVFFISHYRDELDVEVFVEEFKKMEKVHHKEKFPKIVQSFGLKAPMTEYIHSYGQLKQLYDQYDFEQYVVKKPYSRFSNDVHMIRKNEELHSFPIVVQQYIEGREWCTYTIARKNGMTTSIYPSDIHYADGATIYYESTSNETLKELVESLITALDWYGQIAFDLIESNGNYYFLECNPRATSGAYFIPAEAWFQDAEPILTSVQMTPLMFMECCKKPSLSMWKKLFQAKDVVGFENGMKPFFSQFAVAVKWWQEARQYNCTMTEATTRDIEWNGEELE